MNSNRVFQAISVRVILASLFASCIIASAFAAEDITEGWQTLAVVRTAGGEIENFGFFPAEVKLHSPGRADAFADPIILPLGGQFVINGFLSVTASETEIEAFRAMAEKLHEQVKIRPLKYESYGLTVKCGEKLLWDRPTAGGSIRNIPLSLLLDRPENDEPASITIKMSYHWRDTLDHTRLSITETENTALQNASRTSGAVSGAAMTRLEIRRSLNFTQQSSETGMRSVSFERTIPISLPAVPVPEQPKE